MSTYSANLHDPAPHWDPHKWNQLVLFHGTTRRDVDRILAPGNGIKVSYCRPDTDFGPGFYLTSLERQAKHWAWLRYYGRRGSLPGGAGPNYPVVIKFVLDRSALAPLNALQFFVRGSYDDENYWSFVQHCRQNPAPAAAPPYTTTPPNIHRPPPQTPWYDVVAGPVASNWKQRQLALDSDQIRFHTDKAIGLLNVYLDAENKKRSSDFVKEVA
jgi:hypothetical protein